MIRAAIAATLAALALFAAPAEAIPAPITVTVHFYPRDLNGDGGSWAWTMGGYKTTVHVEAPSGAYTKLDALEVDQFLTINSRAMEPGAYRVREISNSSIALGKAEYDLRIQVGFKHIYLTKS